MNSVPNPHTGNPDDVLAARADERLAHAYEQIARADEQLARVTAQLSRLENDGARDSSVIPSLRPSRGRPVLRGLIGFVLAACICAAAYAAQTPYGETARLTVAQWAPHFISTSSLRSEKPGDTAQPIPSSVRLAAAEATPPQPAPTPAPLPPELTQLLRTMAHDIAVVEQGIEQLKANQERMAADNARAIEQLKTNQEQLTRVAAKPSDVKPSEQGLRAKTPAPPPRPPAVANATRKPPSTPPQPARARPQPLKPQPDEPE
jgi:hypothetical protein